MYISIQYLRAIAALLVLFVHISFKLEINSNNLLSWFHIGTSGVDLFFIISGFIMSLTVDIKKIGFLSFMLARIVRIIPLYWFLTSVALLVFLISPSLINSSGGQTSIIRSYFLIPSNYKFLVNNAWTLSYEFFFYLIFSTFLFLGNIQKEVTSITLIALVLIGFIIPFDSPLYLFITSPFLLEFIMGMFCYQVIKIDFFDLFDGVILIILGASLLIIFNIYDPISSELTRVIFIGIPMMLIFIGFVSLEPIMPKFKMMFELGMASYSLYLIHPFLLSFITIISKKIHLVNFPFFYMLTMIVTSCVSSWICYRYIELTLNGIAKKLFIGESIFILKPH